MASLIDLTHPFTAAMPTYPGDPIPTLVQTAALETEGYADHLVHATMHVGTHIDGPLHMLANGKLLSEMPIERFFGRGVLIDIRGKDIIDADALAGKTIQPGDIILFLTGWSKYYTEKKYFASFPELTEALAQKLIDARVGMIGLDAPSPDRPPFLVHKLLLAKEILIAENLANLEALLNVSRFDVIALPAKFATDAAPARVVAQIV